MAEDRPDPYRTLGLPIGATPDEIRRRFRKLARKLQPDVRVGDARAHAQFVEVKRAYETLMDDEARARIEAELVGGLDPSFTIVEDFEATLGQARDLAVEGHRAEAKGLCADLLRARPMDPDVFELLAEIYQAEGNHELEKRMREELARIRGPRRPEPSVTARRAAQGFDVRRDMWTGEAVPKRWWLAALGLAAVLGCVAWVAGDTGSPALSAFSSAEIAAAAASGLVGIGLLAASGVLGSFDLHLGAPVTERGAAAIPMWLYLIVAGMLSAALSLLFYVAFAIFEHGFSKHVLGLFAFVAATAAAMAYAHGGDWLLVMLAGSNVILVSGLIGWAIGSVFRPGNWWE